MSKRFTLLFTLLALVASQVSAQFSTNGIYTIQNAGTSKFITNPGEVGQILTMTESSDNTIQWIVLENGDNFNIISLDEQFIAASDGAKGVLMENTAENRNSETSGALVTITNLEVNLRFESTPDGVLKGWNGQRGGDTQVGMGSTASSKYEWILNRVGDLPNDPPTDITLSITAINDNSGAGAVVGTFSTTDPDANDTFTYTLETSANDGADNAAFTISGDSLIINESTNFSAKSEYKINVKVTDKGDATFVKPFTITVNDPAVNTAPTDITLSATAIDENNAIDATVATLSATDAVVGDTFTYSFETDATDGADNDAFTITGNTLTINSSADFETQSEYKVNLKVTDAGGLSYVKPFTITVNDVNEAPTDIALSDDSINENEASGTVIGTLSATDADANSTFTYTLSGTDAANFSIDGNSLKSAEKFDFEAKTSHSITVTVSDGSLTFNKDFTINVVDVDETALDAPALSKVSFFPNPVKDVLKVGGLTREATASVYTITGTLIKVAKLNASNNSIDVSNLSSGIYLFKLFTEDGGEFVTRISK